MLPVAPFTVVNLAAGAARVRVVDFLIGSVLGLAPGIAIMTAMGDQLETLLRNPSAWNTAALAVLFLLWLMVGVAIQPLLRRRLRGRAAKTADGDARRSCAPTARRPAAGPASPATTFDRKTFW